MRPQDEYRIKAAELAAKADHETFTALRSELESLARGYLRLAKQAERNSQIDVSYAVPNVPPASEWRCLKDQFDALVHGEDVREDSIEMFFDEQVRRRFGDWIARAAECATKTDNAT